MLAEIIRLISLIVDHRILSSPLSSNLYRDMDEPEEDYREIHQRVLQRLCNYIALFATIILNGTSSVLLSLTEREPYHTSILTGKGWVMDSDGQGFGQP